MKAYDLWSEVEYIEYFRLLAEFEAADSKHDLPILALYMDEEIAQLAAIRSCAMFVQASFRLTEHV